MTEHTITVEKTVEEEESVYACNGCGLEIEGDAETYVPNERRVRDEKEIHLHESCESELLATQEPDIESSLCQIRFSLLSEWGSHFRLYLVGIKWWFVFLLYPIAFPVVYNYQEDRSSTPGGDTFMLGLGWAIFVVLMGFVVPELL